MSFRKKLTKSFNSAKKESSEIPEEVELPNQEAEDFGLEENPEQGSNDAENSLENDETDPQSVEIEASGAQDSLVENHHVEEENEAEEVADPIDTPNISETDKVEAGSVKGSNSSAVDVESDKDEIAEYLEDLTVVQGEILPQLVVPDWRDELEFVKERYEPCDLTDHIVKVSTRRLTAKRIEQLLVQSRRSTYNRYLERASRRFKEKIDEDALLHEALKDLTHWRGQQAKSVAWRLADKINQEVVKAKQAEEEATAYVEKNTTFTNPKAVDQYRHFAKRLFFIPVISLYMGSVIGLTYNKFEWLMKHLPFFNLGFKNTLIMISGVSSFFLITTLWRYSKLVLKTQRNLLAFNSKYEDQYKKITHAVREHTRLAQQQPLVEPILLVLAKGYRMQLQSNASVKANVTTNFNASTLPACVGLARAIDTDEVKMARLKRRALGVLMSPGWRTNGLNKIIRIHADSMMLDSNALSLRSLDTDSVVSTNNAQQVLLDAFNNTKIHDRVSENRLREAIIDLHAEVLANWDSVDRPNVVSLRNDGYDKLSFRTSWLKDEDVSENWIEFLNAILEEKTSPFSDFNIQDKESDLNKVEMISSVAVVPHYFPVREDSKVKTIQSPIKEVMPLDVVVRVDVSPWSDPSAFTIFADGKEDMQSSEEGIDRGGTSA